MHKFNTIGIVGRRSECGVADTLKQLVSYLKGRKLAVVLRVTRQSITETWPSCTYSR